MDDDKHQLINMLGKFRLSAKFNLPKNDFVVDIDDELLSEIDNSGIPSQLAVYMNQKVQTNCAELPPALVHSLISDIFLDGLVPRFKYLQSKITALSEKEKRLKEQIGEVTGGLSYEEWFNSKEEEECRICFRQIETIKLSCGCIVVCKECAINNPKKDCPKCFTIYSTTQLE